MWNGSTLMGTAAVGAYITNQSIEDTRSSGVDVVKYRLNTNGNAESFTTTAGVYSTISGQWCINGTPTLFECWAQQQSGDAVGGSALDTWLALTSSREWTMSAGIAVENLIGTILVKIRRVGSSNFVSATITLDAERT